MAALYEVVGSFTPLTRAGEQWTAPCPFTQHDGQLEVIGDRWRCSCGAHDAGDDALAFLRAIGEPDPEGALANGRIWTPTLLKPTPPVRKYSLASLRQDAKVLIVDNLTAAKAAEALLPLYTVYAWPNGGPRWDLEPLRGRECLLWPSADGIEAMLRLEAVIADPAGLACTGKVVELAGPDDVAPWDTDGKTLISWAKMRVRPLKAPPNPAQQVASPPSSSEAEAAKPVALPDERAATPPADAGPIPDAPESPQTSAEPPPLLDSDWPPETQPRPRKRRLRVVGGGDMDAPDPDPDADPLPEELSEDAMAEEFAAQHGEDWRCVDAWNKWLHWDGEAWCEDRDHSRVEPMRMLYRRALQTPAAKTLTADGRRKMGGQAKAYASLRYAGTDRRIRSTPEVWDMDPYMLGVPGGVVDLKAGKLIESAREQHITMRCSVAPARGEPSAWLEMLRYWQGDDQDVIGFIRRYLGYALTGDGREQCMAFFYGPAASGKGTIMRLVSYLLGSVPPPGNTKFRSYHYEAPIATFLESRSDRHTTELAAMHQKRLITSEEPAAGAKWDEAKIKWLTGGSFITARYMRGDNFSFSMTGKIIVAANHRPRLATTDASIKRRMHVIPFEHPVADEDRDNNLDARLRAEAPQILNWLIEACLEWQECGLGLPEKISDSTANYLQAEDVLAQWIDESCDRDGSCESKALYQSYCRWAEEQGEKVWSRRAWANALVERGFQTKRGTAGVRMFVGLTPRVGANLP